MSELKNTTMALTKHIMVRVNQQDYNTLSKQAEDARLSISAFARQKLLVEPQEKNY